MNTMKLQFPAAKGHQAGRDNYLLSMPMTFLKRLMAFDTGNVLDRSQREVEAPRAKKIAAYIVDAVRSQGFYVLPTLTGTVDKATFIEQGNGVGILEIDMDAVIHLFDGQHRATGIIEACSKLEGFHDSISILLYPELTLVERQQAFADINDNVKKPTKAITTVYNHRDPLSQLAVRLATECDSFVDLVDFEKNLITGSSAYAFSIKSIKDATKEMFGLKTTAVLGDELAEKALILWDAWREPLGWGMLSDIGAETHRERYISTQSVMLHVAAIVTRVLMGQHNGDAEAVAERIKALDEVEERLTRNYWDGRLVIAGKTQSTKQAKMLAANKWLSLLGVELPSAHAELERRMFGAPSYAEAREMDLEPIAEPIQENAFERILDELDELHAVDGDDESVELPWGMTEDEYDAYEAKVADLFLEFSIDPTRLDEVAEYLERTLDEKGARHKGTLRKALAEFTRK